MEHKQEVMATKCSLSICNLGLDFAASPYITLSSFVVFLVEYVCMYAFGTVFI